MRQRQAWHVDRQAHHGISAIAGRLPHGVVYPRIQAGNGVNIMAKTFPNFEHDFDFYESTDIYDRVVLV